MIYLITNRHLINKEEYYSQLDKISTEGIDGIILREKDLHTEELYQVATRVKEIISPNKTPLIINSNIDVAEKINAEGIHLSYKDYLNYSRAFSGIVGVSVHSIEEAVKVQEKGFASYVLASHIFETSCKKGLKPKGTDWIKQMRNKLTIPIIALGGINETNCTEVINAGADGIAVMSYLMKAKNPNNKVKLLNSSI